MSDLLADERMTGIARWRSWPWCAYCYRCARRPPSIRPDLPPLPRRTALWWALHVWPGYVTASVWFGRYRAWRRCG